MIDIVHNEDDEYVDQNNESEDQQTILKHQKYATRFYIPFLIKWIRALYLEYASAYLVVDFRITASAQFKLLAALCSLCEKTVFQGIVDFNKTQLITIQLLQESEVQSYTDENVRIARTNILAQIVSPLNFIQITTRANSLYSALNTNTIIFVYSQYTPPFINQMPTYYFDKDLIAMGIGFPCYLNSKTAPAGFYSLSLDVSSRRHVFWPINPLWSIPNASAMVNGFYGGCIPLDALLASTLDCLYNITCLQIFPNYFPALSKVNLNWTYGSILLIIIFTSISTEMTAMIVSNPTLSNYKYLKDLYPNTFRCSCSNAAIPYGKFLSLSPVLHRICSSDYITESWILLDSFYDVIYTDGSTSARYVFLGFTATHFRLLSEDVTCTCATDPYCTIGIPSKDDMDPGIILGCAPVYNISWVQVRPLIYDQKTSRFPPDTLLSTIVKEMMVDQWNNVSSFDSYYEGCAPTYCTYINTKHTFNFFGIIMKVLSTIGGLCIILRLIISQLIQFIYKLLEPKINRQEQNRPPILNRIKQMMRNLIMKSYTTLINVNIFPIRTFGSNIDRLQSKSLGRWATRLYIILLIISFVIFSFYMIIQPRILTKTVSQPSLMIYNRLLAEYDDTIQCPCSSVSSLYNKFINIRPEFHEICSSPIVSNEWRINITSGLVFDLSTYDTKDYRRFFSAHFRFLAELCNLSIQSVNNSIDQLLLSSFVTGNLISQKIFDIQIDSIIEDSKSYAPTVFARLLSLLRSTNHGNAIITAYGTNFQYIIPWYNLSISSAITQPMIYDNECSCASTANCTTSAQFINLNSSENIHLQGLKMGCTPTESLLASTLECFYNQLCIKLIQETINNNSNNRNILLPVLTNKSQFLINTTINNLVQKLFIEQWSTTKDYSLYFDQCSPVFCSYTYSQKINSFETITILLGLYEG
ncbi:hypothetical protein I4U23_031576 [Adineta vaga]|nr:hypothetical protein I4U23_031576 [Adineta vaga]